MPASGPAKPEEMAGAVLYLCSDAASYISGQVHLADRAFTARGMFPTEMAGKTSFRWKPGFRPSHCVRPARLMSTRSRLRGPDGPEQARVPGVGS